MKRSIFYFERLNSWDIWTTLIYTVITAYVFLGGKTTELLSIYGLGTQMFTLLFNYQSLRNFSVYLIWMLFGLLHFFMYLNLKNNSALNLPNINEAVFLRNTFIILLIFQILRIISLNIQHQDFVVPTKGGYYDVFNERKLTIVDYVIFLIFIGAVISLDFLV